MSESPPSAAPRWIIIATALCGLVAAVFVAAAKYYEYQKAKRDAGPPVAAGQGPGGSGAGEEGTARFREDFSRVAEGALPAGWSGDEAISVRKGGDRARLEVSEKGLHRVTLPKVAIKGDFFAECEFTKGWEQSQVELTLLGAGGGKDLTLVATATGGGTNVASTLRVTLANLDPKESTKSLQPPLYKLRLERQGAIYRVSVNGESVLARPVSGYGDFAGARLALPGGDANTRFYSIEVGPLPGGEGP